MWTTMLQDECVLKNEELLSKYNVVSLALPYPSSSALLEIILISMFTFRAHLHCDVKLQEPCR